MIILFGDTLIEVYFSNEYLSGERVLISADKFKRRIKTGAHSTDVLKIPK